MIRLRFAPAAVLALLSTSSGGSRSPVRIAINDNRAAAGTLRDGVLTLRLEVGTGEWHPDADSAPGIVLRAFAEPGKAPQIPGPLIRVPEGTAIHAFVHNPLDSTLFLHGLGADSTAIAPGNTGEVQFKAATAGTYYYWASTRRGPPGQRSPLDEELAGMLIVDPAGSAGAPRDRVLLIAEWAKGGPNGGFINRGEVLRFTINGKAWPHTERLAYSVGDTIRFRVANLTDAPHPMHLHGFYYRVLSRGDGSHDTRYDPPRPPQLVVTERMAPGRTISLEWVPERAGYWLFHCHNNFHILRNEPLDGSALPPEQTLHPRNHALELMGGLVMGIEVRPSGSAAPPPVVARRKLRLIARVDSAEAGTDAEPAFGYELQENGHSSARKGPLLPGPTILLQRGEPVSITVVNRLSEGTAVHWHGIELDSYMDGVGGFSGHPGRIAPVIESGDSFEARFTPPRAGTFIYHPHADEVRQLRAGMSGALLVLEDPAAFDPTHDLVMLVSAPRHDSEDDRVLLNGSLDPVPLELRSGERYRFRLINIHTNRPSLIVRILRDSTAQSWRAVAKDGMDLPAERATLGPAVVQFGNGETYDFEFTPKETGDYRLIVTSGVGELLVTQRIRVGS